MNVTATLKHRPVPVYCAECLHRKQGTAAPGQSRSVLVHSRNMLKTAPATIKPRSNLIVHASAGQGSSSFNYSADELAGKGKAQTFAYRGLAFFLGAVGLALLAEPSRALEVAYAATPSVLLAHLVRALGAVHLLAAVMASTLSDAASHARLSSDTYKSLNLGLIAWGVCSLAAFFKSPVVATQTFQAVYGSLLAACVVVPMLSAQGLLLKLPRIKISPLATPDKVYKLAAGLALAFGASVLFTAIGAPAPSVPSVSWLATPLGSCGATMLSLLGSSSILTFFTLTTLADAAQRGRLGASTFKALNRGVAILSGTLCALGLSAHKTGTVKLAAAVPGSLADAITRWPDALSAASFVVVPVLGLMSLYLALAAKK